MNLDAQIEAILFCKAESLSEEKLAELLNVSQEDIIRGIETLEVRLAGTGLTLMRSDSEVMLRVAPGGSALIERIAKEELSREIGKAGIETLAIVLYRGPVTRSEIDYIRGVNSAFILRSLMIRGLVERSTAEGGGRSPRYVTTFELLSHLGVAKVTDIPDYEATRAHLAAFETQGAGVETETSKEAGDTAGEVKEGVEEDEMMMGHEDGGGYEGTFNLKDDEENSA